MGALLLPAAAALASYGALRRQRERPRRDFVIGTVADADLNLAHAAVPSERFPLVHAEGRGYALLFTRSMSGDVTLGDQRVALGWLADSDRVCRANEHGDAFAYPIPQGARIKLDLGATTLLVHSVAPAQRLPHALGQRPDWLPTMGVSAAAHLLLLFLVFALPPDAKALSLDLFDRRQRAAQVPHPGPGAPRRGPAAVARQTRYRAERGRRPCPTQTRPGGPVRNPRRPPANVGAGSPCRTAFPRWRSGRSASRRSPRPRAWACWD
ncbi:MAG: hypothetical protein IPG96_20505 [Proteobacteria bacterium]|nr:hypothetical protein [Pseudomonadota bacterium]